MKSERRLEVEEYAERQIFSAAAEFEAFVAVFHRVLYTGIGIKVVVVSVAEEAHMGDEVDVFAERDFETRFQTYLPCVVGVGAGAVTHFGFERDEVKTTVNEERQSAELASGVAGIGIDFEGVHLDAIGIVVSIANAETGSPFVADVVTNLRLDAEVALVVFPIAAEVYRTSGIKLCACGNTHNGKKH